MKTRILFFFSLFTVTLSFAQQDSQFTQYMYNTININPAYAGSRGVLSVFGLHRTQWVGIDGAPVTNAFSVNTPINNNRFGVGVSVVNDRIGPTNENTFSGDVSYTIKTSEDYKLSFGLKGTLNFFNLDVNRLNPADQNDPKFQNLNGVVTPNIGIGFYFHSDNTYFGLSAPNFLESIRYSDNSVSIFKEKVNYYFIGGHVFNVSPNVKFKPALLTKMVQGAPLQVDVSGNFLIQDKFTIGVAYRYDAAISLLTGFQITDGLFMGYGYDLETTKLYNYNSGSHEIFLRYELFKECDCIITPRFF
ncbi:MAG: type IX secretion system membrane protein PorP/SprF [Bacteroidota bacterium]